MGTDYVMSPEVGAYTRHGDRRCSKGRDDRTVNYPRQSGGHTPSNGNLIKGKVMATEEVRYPKGVGTRR